MESRELLRRKLLYMKAINTDRRITNQEAHLVHLRVNEHITLVNKVITTTNNITNILTNLKTMEECRILNDQLDAVLNLEDSKQKPRLQEVLEMVQKVNSCRNRIHADNSNDEDILKIEQLQRNTVVLADAENITKIAELTKGITELSTEIRQDLDKLFTRFPQTAKMLIEKGAEQALMEIQMAERDKEN